MRGRGTNVSMSNPELIQLWQIHPQDTTHRFHPSTVCIILGRYRRDAVHDRNFHRSDVDMNRRKLVCMIIDLDLNGGIVRMQHNLTDNRTFRMRRVTFEGTDPQIASKTPSPTRHWIRPAPVHSLRPRLLTVVPEAHRIRIITVGKSTETSRTASVGTVDAVEATRGHGCWDRVQRRQLETASIRDSSSQSEACKSSNSELHGLERSLPFLYHTHKVKGRTDPNHQ